VLQVAGVADSCLVHVSALVPITNVVVNRV